LLRAVGASLAQGEEAFILVKAGKPMAVICSGAEPSTLTNLAINAIQQRVEALARVRLPVTTDAEAPGQDGQTLILVGTSSENPLLKKTAAANGLGLQEAELGGEGFRLVTLMTKDGKGCIFAAGTESPGAYHAGCWLARRILAGGDTVYVPALDLKEKPHLSVRGVYDGEWQSDALKMTKTADRYHPDNLPWWKDYIDFLGALGANHFEVWPRIMHGPSGLKEEEIRQCLDWLDQVSAYCRGRGMEFYVVACANVVDPSYLKDSPELRAEGVGDKPGWVCPSKPGGTELLLRVYGEAIALIKNRIDGVVFYGYDPGGCNCRQCGGMHKEYYRTYMGLTNKYRELIRHIAPRIKVCATLWYFETHEQQKVLESIDEWPRDLEIQFTVWSPHESPSYLTPIRHEWVDVMRGLSRTHRVVMWDHETDMESVMWLENPLPDRIGRRVELAKEMGCVGAIGFILSHPVKLINSAVLVQKAWNPSLTTEEALMEFSRALFASEDERIVSAIVYLARWAELLGEPQNRTLDLGMPAGSDKEAKWQKGIEYGQKAAQLLAQAEGTVRLRKDYYAYLKRLARIYELICVRLLKQSRASDQVREWQTLEEIRPKQAALKKVLDLLEQTNAVNSQIEEELKDTPLAAVPSLVDAQGCERRLRDSIYNGETIAGQIGMLKHWQEDALLLSKNLEEWRGTWWNREWNYRVKIAALCRPDSKLLDPSMEGRNRYWRFQAGTKAPGLEFAWAEDAHTGKTAALLAVNEQTKSFVLLEALPSNTEAVGIATGRNYRVSFWYKVLSGKPKLYLDLYAGGKADGNNIYPDLVCDAQWHPCSVVLESPELSAPGTAALRFVAHSDPQRILIDDVSIQPDDKEGGDHFLAKCPIDFAQLLGTPKQPAEVALASLRLVQYEKGGNVISEVPVELEPDPGRSKTVGNLYWPLQSKPEEERVRFYYLYFDLVRNGKKPTRESTKVSGRLRDSSLEQKTEWWEMITDAQPPVVELAWSDDAHVGNTAALLSVNEECKNYALLQTNAANNRAMQIRPRRTYQVSFWYKVLSGEPKFYLDFFAGLGPGDGRNVCPSLIADGKWHRCSLSLEAPEFSPEQAAALRFVAHYNSQSILIDDVEVLRTPVPLVLSSERAERLDR